ncbi:MAG: hypothetical protein EA342_03755 [Leptolyngbya sp. LCM1.Bin17]|jgi:hypothetical protein|nr:MAG: hypothetical protein EA342_03755 [Leptolyngbya sp. LCM1.Bin17]
MVSTPHSAGLSPEVIKPFLAGGLLLALIGLVFDFQGARRWWSASGVAATPSCEAIVRSDAQLSREQLAKLLTVPERGSKETVREIVAEPYCRMASLPVRSGVTAEREAYPLAFDPSTQLIILYENDEYAGYRFRFQ